MVEFALNKGRMARDLFLSAILCLMMFQAPGGLSYLVAPLMGLAVAGGMITLLGDGVALRFDQRRSADQRTFHHMPFSTELARAEPRSRIRET